ncbi:hypothetical protein HY992_01990 [Candidatus Micrarchaeota archaeon]|nr:hypothetical protein [Candidatus Micrarchaeota archaeon]
MSFKRGFNENLLMQKRERFLEAVNKSCNDLSFTAPHVNFYGCSSETDDSLAHFHPDVYTICVSKIQLSKMNFEDVFNTATHEVTRIMELSHNDKFHRQHKELKARAWMPPVGRGLIYIRAGGVNPCLWTVS